MIDVNLAGQRATLRFDGRLMHVIAGEQLQRTKQAPIPLGRASRLSGARSEPVHFHP